MPSPPAAVVQVTASRPSGVFSIFAGTALWMNLTPCEDMCSTMLSAHCRSNPRSGTERTITCVSYPMPARKPPHSSETYPAPTHSVLPGGSIREKMSSLEIASSPPGHSSGEGRPPTATTMRRPVIVVRFFFLSTHSIACGSAAPANDPSALMYSTLFSSCVRARAVKSATPV
jgi:hypothetical protein